MFLNSSTCGLRKINLTGLLSSNPKTGNTPPSGEDSTGLILRRRNAKTGMNLNGSIGLSASNNSGNPMLTALLMASNTGILKTNKSGLNGSSLRNGLVSIGRNSTGLICRTLTYPNGSLKTGRNGLSDNKLMLIRRRIKSSLSLKIILLMILKMMTGLLMKTTTSTLRLRFLLVSRCGDLKTRTSSLLTLMLPNGKVTIGKNSTGCL